LVTNLEDPPEEIGCDYNQGVPRGGMEQRIEQLKSDLAADDFCLLAGQSLARWDSNFAALGFSTARRRANYRSQTSVRSPESSSDFGIQV